MVNYQKGKIYKIVCDETGLVYYGSTVQRLSDRLAKHKQKQNTCKSNEMKNPKIYLVETFPCNSKEELHSRERYYIENNECINSNIPLRKDKEYRHDNKERISQYKKKYHENNREKILERAKLNLHNCECGSTIRYAEKSRHFKTKKHQDFLNQ